MKKNLRNFEIENIVAVLTHNNSFLKNISVKLPYEFRQAVRINLKTLTERLSFYDEENKELVQSFVDSGYATDNGDGTIKVKEECRETVLNELNELSNVNNELEIVTVDETIIEKIKAMDISMTEESVLDFFIAE